VRKTNGAGPYERRQEPALYAVHGIKEGECGPPKDGMLPAGWPQDHVYEAVTGRVTSRLPRDIYQMCTTAAGRSGYCGISHPATRKCDTNSAFTPTVSCTVISTTPRPSRTHSPRDREYQQLAAGDVRPVTSWSRTRCAGAGAPKRHEAAPDSRRPTHYAETRCCTPANGSPCNTAMARGTG
jgi:hypothetical protein